MDDYTIIKGELDDVQRRALELTLAELADRNREAKPHSRGHYGAAVLHDNPQAFRNPRLPRV